jgi:N-acetylglucosaminyldiphosphoundecaprenol N-acetyl-beta-D-mannosaminyltransferase
MPHVPFPVQIGPLRIDPIDLQELKLHLINHVKASDHTYHVVTANAQFLTLAEKYADFRDCLADAEYVCADGISLVLACNWLKHVDIARVPGVDLVEALCADSSLSQLSVYFLGGKEGAAEEACAALGRRYPGFRAAGICCPPQGFENSEETLRPVLEGISRVKPSVLFVALGAPRQELFIRNHIRPLGVSVAIGVGGSFEMLAGRVRRAPQWVRNSGLEWAFRWVQEPRRLARRYLVGNSQFCFYMLQYFLNGGNDRHS